MSVVGDDRVVVMMGVVGKDVCHSEFTYCIVKSGIFL